MAKANQSICENQGLNELTKEEIRKYKGLENLTDIEAENVAATLKVFSILTYQMFEQSNHKQNE
jgi:hypothetical protein